MIAQEVIEEIKNRANIADIIGEYVHLTLKGDRYWGLSPFKTEKTPSFTVTPSRGMYYCFSTQKGGNVFSFIMEMEGMTFPEAVEFVGRKVGIDVRQSDQAEVSEDIKKRRALEELYQKISDSFHHLLLNSPKGQKALEYVLDRGLDIETVKNFRLGYAPDDAFWLHGFLVNKGYSSEFLAESGLFSSKNPRWNMFADRLIFPINRHQGGTIGFGGRILSGDGPKYLNSPDTRIFHKRQTLYGLDLAKDAIRKAGYFIICEGYLDVIAFHQAGLALAVAPLGTALTTEQAALLSRYARKALLVFDGDEAGIQASRKAALIMEQAELEVQVLPLKKDEDPADILKKNGSQALKNLVLSALTALDFLLMEAVSKSDIHSPEGKERILEQLFPYIRSIASPVKQEASLQIVSERLSVSFESVAKAFRIRTGSQGTRNDESRSFTASRRAEERPGTADKFQPVSPGKKDSLPALSLRNPEVQLLVALFVHPQLFTGIRAQFPLAEVKNEVASQLYVILEEAFRDGKMIFDEIIEQIHNQELKGLILKKASVNEYGEDPGQYVNAALNRVKKELLNDKRKEVEFRLRMAEKSNPGAVKELLAEKMYLDSELKELKESIHD